MTAGNGAAQEPSREECEQLGAEFWHGFLIKGVAATWDDMTQAEQEAGLALWRRRKERETAAALEQTKTPPPQPAPAPEQRVKRVHPKSLDELITACRLPNFHINGSALALSLLLVQREFGEALSTINRQIRAHVNEQNGFLIKRLEDAQRALRSAQSAEISALRQERDYLKDRHEEDQDHIRRLEGLLGERAKR